MRQRLTPTQLRTRIDAIDAARLTRALTPAERIEADNLAHRLYMRTYRADPVAPVSAAARR